MNYEVMIRDYIIKHINIDFEEDDFNNDDNVFNMGFVNSLFAMTLVTYIENEFKINIEIDDLDIANFSSVNRIVTFIKTKEGKL